MEVKEEIKGIEKEERVTWGGIRRGKNYDIWMAYYQNSTSIKKNGLILVFSLAVNIATVFHSQTVHFLD